MSPKVFLITGCSTGFGNDYVQEVLEKGDHVIATARKPESLKFEKATEKNFLGVALDVTDHSSIDKAFKAGLEKFGRIDVICNNAGYGLGGPFETLTNDQIHTQFDVNFFGLLDVTRKGLEVMRDQKPSGGIIQQVTSIGGQTGVPGFSSYCATKWAVEGFTEALAQEVKPEWGIKFTCIEPGGFRTDWAGRSMIFGENQDKQKVYDHLDMKANMKKRNGTQGGDPRKAAVQMHKLAVMANPPLRVVLGQDAYERISKKVQDYSKHIEENKEMSLACQVDE